MASCARAIEQAGAVSVDKSLWWESHEALFQDLDAFTSSYGRPSVDPFDGDDHSYYSNSKLGTPLLDSAILAQRLRAYHPWLLDNLLCFKAPSASSCSAINVAKVVVGSHMLEIKDDIRNLTLELSAKLVLDEVQTYILVSRFFASDESALSYAKETLIQKIAMRYYFERQCVLKCIIIILLFQMVEKDDGDMNEEMHEELRRLLKGGIDEKILTLLELLFTTQHSAHLDPNLAVICAEATVLEQSLVMDIIFLLYYEPVITCKASYWKKLFTVFQERIFSGAIAGKLAITTYAEECIQHIKNQAFLILIETLNLDKLLKMVFDEVPFSKGGHAFTLEELQDIDAMFGAFDLLEASEYSLLLFSWAIFICLVSSLPSAEGEPTLLEIDHAMYMRQSYENGAYNSLFSMLLGERFQESDILTGGYKSIAKTLLSAFLAAYDIGNQTESGILDEMAEIFYEIYHGQECLCTEFWDRESIIDGPVRSLLLALREIFPYKFIPFVRLLSGLCEGSWAAECVYEFLHSMVRVTSLYEVSSVMKVGQCVQTAIPLQISSAPGLLIPAETKGHVLQVVNESLFLVQWECKHSGIILLIVRMMHQVTNSLKSEEVHAILNLLCQLVSSNKLLVHLLLNLDTSTAANAARSDGRMVTTLRLDILEIVSSIIYNLLETSGGHQMVTLCIKCLTAFGLYCPGRVICKLSEPSPFYSSNAMTDKINDKFFYQSVLKMAIEPDQAAHGYLVTDAVLDFCVILVNKGVQSDCLNLLVEHLISNALVNHVAWKYKWKYERWQISAKVFRLINVVFSAQSVVPELHTKLVDVLMLDNTVHGILVQVLSVGRRELEELYVNRSVDAKEIEWFERTLCSCLTLIHWLIFDITTGHSMRHNTMTQLEHAILYHSGGASSIVSSVASYISFSKNMALQLASVRAFAALCLIAERAKPHPISIASYLSSEEQKILRQMLGVLLRQEVLIVNIEMFYSVTDLLMMAAKHEPSLIIFLLDPIEDHDQIDIFGKQLAPKIQPIESGKDNAKRSEKQEIINRILELLVQAKPLFDSQPRVLSSILQLLSTLWQRGVEFFRILEAFSSSEDFWKLLTVCISMKVYEHNIKAGNLSSEQNIKRSFQYLCQAFTLEIMIFDIFLKQVLVEADVSSFQTQVIAEKDATNLKESDQLLLKWVDEGQLEIILMSFAHSIYSKEAVLKAKAEMRALIVGLMVKVSTGNDMGLSASLVKDIKATLNIVINHPSFQDLLTYYSTLKYSHGKDLQILVLSDLYYHLRGELEGCRQIPAGSFQQLACFLDSFDFASILHPRKKYAEVATPLHSGGFIYDLASFKYDLGLEWWPQIDCKFISTTAIEGLLQSLEYANSVCFVGESQLAALEAWIRLLSITIYNRQQSAPVILCSGSMWKKLHLDACIQKLCTALEVAEEQLGPCRCCTVYVPIYMTAQAQLLQVLAWWLFNHVASGIDTDVSSTCTIVVKTTLKCIKTILGSIEHVHKSLVKKLLGVLLICLELLHFKSQTTDEKNKSNLFEQNMDDTFVDVALLSMSSLPILCSLVEDKGFGSVCIAAIDIIVKGFLAPPTWVPILQMHFPIRSTLSRIHTHNGTDFSHQALNLFLSLACSKAGAEMLYSSGFFTHLMSFCNEIRDVDVLGQRGFEGPFCAFQKNLKKNDANWSICVAIVTGILQSLGDKNGGSAVTEIAFLFFASEKEKMLRALKSPFFVDDHGGKRPRIQKPQTTTFALRETQYVLLLMIELINYPVHWSHTLQSLDPQFIEMCVHLLAYVAKEGLVRNINSNLRSNLHCFPLSKEEITAHQKPSILGCSNGWFSVTAKGCPIKNSVGPQTSSVSMLSHNKDKQQIVVFNKTQLPSVGALILAHTQYTDLVAISVYRVAFLLLTFICKKVQQTLNRHNECGSNDLFAFPELPAPEILYALQDQAIAIITEVCSRRFGSDLEQESLCLCYLMFGIIEKTLYLDVCVSRVCGIGPLSIRSEDFLKEYKALFQAVQDNQFLDMPLKSLKGILRLAYPGLF